MAMWVRFLHDIAAAIRPCTVEWGSPSHGQRSAIRIGAADEVHLRVLGGGGSPDFLWERVRHVSFDIVANSAYHINTRRNVG